ncbi:MAG: glycoside hydrolase family 57 protein [Candidatus Kapaibacteriales bacterium]
MSKLKIAFLWHFHQPYYVSPFSDKGEMALPWVRLHGVKDYRDLPLAFLRHPTVKHTINLTPSLFEQIKGMIDGDLTDTAMRLSSVAPEELSDSDKRYLIDNFFTINHENLLMPHAGYRRLLEKDRAAYELQDYLDLQTWYNLAWIGKESAKYPYIEYLLLKGENYTIDERNFVLEYHIKLLKDIGNTFGDAKNLGVVNFSFTPFYHPILPILDNSDGDEKSIYSNPDNVKNQILEGKKYAEDYLGSRIVGSWPSEGSLSNEVLDEYIRLGIKWVATDEEMLHESETSGSISATYPYRYSNADGQILVFFRDRMLSDKIGFHYTQMDKEDAVSDFIETLRSKKQNLEELDSLDDSVISIILDGENCWEFYRNGGWEFIDHFLGRIAEENDWLETVHFDDLANRELSNTHELISIKSGSWINSNFDIWNGHLEDRLAWYYLSEAKGAYGGSSKKLNTTQKERIEKQIKICEGSDWYWWFGPDHKAPDREKFDSLFRDNLKRIYSLLGIDHPKYLDRPIMGTEEADLLSLEPETRNRIVAKKSLEFSVNGILEDFVEASLHGKVVYEHRSDTMHEGGLYPVLVKNFQNTYSVKLSKSIDGSHWHFVGKEGEAVFDSNSNLSKNSKFIVAKPNEEMTGLLLDGRIFLFNT